MKAKIEIRIWSDADQPSTEDLVDMFRPHVEHVARMLAEGYRAGEIVGDNFTGWWDITS